jgi:hypothetical protein
MFSHSLERRLPHAAADVLVQATFGAPYRFVTSTAFSALAMTCLGVA